MKLPFSNIGNKLSSPWLIALIPFVITLIFTTEFFNKYNLKLISRDATGYTLNLYEDLDNDGNSEILQFYTYQNAELLVYNLNNKLEEVYDLPGKWFDGHERTPAFFIGDWDNDNFREIFTFTINDNDSLFVSVIHHYPKKEIIRNKFITILPKLDDHYDYILSPIGLEDNNGDKFPELLFVINAGFPLQPRAVFAWDIKNDSIYRSPIMGNAIKPRPYISYFKDVDGDNIKEIFLHTVSPNNYKLPFPYSDQNSWIMVFSKNLNFLFEPVQIKGPQIELYHFPEKSGDSVIVGINIYNDKPDNIHPSFQFYNQIGEKISETDLPAVKEGKFNQFFKINNKDYLIGEFNENLKISILNQNKNGLIKSIVFPTLDYSLFFHDIDSDGEIEIIIFQLLLEKITVIRSNLENLTEIPLSYSKFSDIRSISTAYKNHIPDHFLFFLDGVANYLSYSKNPFYFLNFVLAALYYFLLVFAFGRLKKVWLSNLQQKQQTEMEMQNLQIQTVIGQLNPHFTFNAMNVVGSAILNGENDKAYDSLTRVSRLLRKSVDDAMLPYKTLKEEIEFVKEYLEIEKMRFGEKLEYETDIDKSVDLRMTVPKMLIHVFVENAIKHGIYQKKNGGSIFIKLVKKGDQTIITVEDNGIGRQKAREFSNGRKGKGIQILKNYLQIFKEQFKREITFEHSDVLINNEVCGTIVEIKINQ